MTVIGFRRDSDITKDDAGPHPLPSSPTMMISPPSSISLEVAQQATKIAKIAYRALNLSSLASFDFIVKVSGVQSVSSICFMFVKNQKSASFD